MSGGRRVTPVPRLVAIGVALGALGSAATAQTPARDSAARERAFWQFLGYPSLVKGGALTPRWMADGASFWYVQGGPDSAVAYRVDPATGAITPLLDVPRTRRALAVALGHDPPYRGLPFADLTLLPEEKAVRFTLEGRDFLLALSDYSITPVPTQPTAERNRYVPQVVRPGRYGGDPDLKEVLSPDRRWFARDQDHNIWIRSTVDGRMEPLTTDGVADWEWSTSVNSDLSETDATAKWSPDGLRLAVMKADTRNVARVPLLHWLKPTEEVEWRPYVKAGGPMAAVDLYIVDLLSKRQLKVDVGHADQYVIPISWVPDGSELLVYRMSRDYKTLDVLAADARTGATRILVHETQKTFIKGISSLPAWTQLFTPVGDGKRFLWLSERDGWDHLYLYGMDGALIRRLTSGAFPVLSVAGVDEKQGWVYFYAHAEPRLYDTHLYRVGLDGRPAERLTQGSGQHAVVLSPSNNVFIDTHSSLDRPPAVELRSAGGKLIKVLARASVDSLTALGWKAPEEFVVKAADGATDLYGVIVKPADFDAARRYPVIEYIYGGPQLVNMPRAFGQSAMQQGFAQLGFVVVTLDARGTTERGKAFQDVVYGNFGRNEIPDHAGALKQLAAARPYMDLGRVGIFGGSWGGYMTVRAMVLAPDVYHVGVARYPVGDLYDHWSLIEAYMGMPQDNRAGYDYGSSLRLAGNLKGHLLLTHGTNDVNATFSATMKIVDALTRANKPYDLRIFPEESHAFSAAAHRYWLETTKSYFIEHLRPE
ncbi:MAG: DPP IV N-terminal domain-containing protein [Gemmatimonadota bacterium]